MRRSASAQIARYGATASGTPNPARHRSAPSDSTECAVAGRPATFQAQAALASNSVIVKLKAAQLGGSHLGTPFEPTVTDQAEQLLPGLGQRTDGCTARRNDAVVGRHDICLRATKLGRCPSRLGGVQAGLCGVGGSLCLDALLRAVEALLPKLPGAFIVGLCLSQGGCGFGDRSPALGEFAVDRVAGDACEHVALGDRFADIGENLGNPVVADFRADDGFLPGGHVTAGGECLRPGQYLRCHRSDRERRLCSTLGGRWSLVAATGQGD